MQNGWESYLCDKMHQVGSNGGQCNITTMVISEILQGSPLMKEGVKNWQHKPNHFVHN